MVAVQCCARRPSSGSVQNSLLHCQFNTAYDVLDGRIGLSSIPARLDDIDRRIVSTNAASAGIEKELADPVAMETDVKKLERRLTHATDAHAQLTALRAVLTDLTSYLRNVDKALKRHGNFDIVLIISSVFLSPCDEL